MTPTPKAELSEKKYLPYRQDGDRIILAKIATMPLNVGGYYEIRPGKAWDGGRHCRIVSLHDGHAVCDGRKGGYETKPQASRLAQGNLRSSLRPVYRRPVLNKAEEKMSAKAGSAGLAAG